MTMLPTQQRPAMFSWQQPLAALFGGLSAAGQPGGLANFGAGVNQTMQAQSQQAQQQQIAELRRMQIEQAQMEMNRANTEDAQRKATIERLRNLGGAGGATPVRPVGNYGAATGGAPQPSMFGGNPQAAMIYGGMLDAGNVEGALKFAADFAKPDEFKPDLTTFYEGDQQYQGYLGPDGKPVRVTENAPRWAPKTQQEMAIDFNGDGTPDFVMGGGNVKLTEAQSKDTGWAARLEGAITDMAAAESSGYDPTAGGATMDYIGQRNIGGLLGNILTSDQGKQWYRGAKEALAVILRKDSGGAITPEEFKMYGPIYLPMPWDDPQTKTAKNQALQTTLGALKTTSGGGYDVNKARSDAQTPPPAPALDAPATDPNDPLGLRKKP
jgi:hypothetical protein